MKRVRPPHNKVKRINYLSKRTMVWTSSVIVWTVYLDINCNDPSRPHTFRGCPVLKNLDFLWLHMIRCAQFNKRQANLQDAAGSPSHNATTPSPGFSAPMCPTNHIGSIPEDPAIDTPSDFQLGRS